MTPTTIGAVPMPLPHTADTAENARRLRGSAKDHFRTSTHRTLQIKRELAVTLFANHLGVRLIETIRCTIPIVDVPHSNPLCFRILFHVDSQPFALRRCNPPAPRTARKYQVERKDTLDVVVPPGYGGLLPCSSRFSRMALSEGRMGPAGSSQLPLVASCTLIALVGLASPSLRRWRCFSSEGPRV